MKTTNQFRKPEEQARIDAWIKEQSEGAKPFDFLKADEEVASGSEHTPRAATTTGLTPYAGELSKENVLHLLKRTLFGAKQSDVDAFMQLSVSEAIDQLVQTSPIPPEPVNDYNTTSNPAEQDPDVAIGESWVDAPYNNGDNAQEGNRLISLCTWLMNNMIQQEQTIHEKMVLFWNNLLPTQAFGIFVAKMSYRYFELLRRNALGNYKTMIKELTLDPCMLFYLNGASNNRYAPDENYGRELQELFTVGKGPNSKFTESDVQAAARVLTGFTSDWGQNTNWGPMESIFYADWHDTDDKQFSEFYGNRLIEGKSGQAGAEELDEMLDMIFDNEETALYICRRFYNFFVFSEIDESVEQNVIVPLAQIFRDNDYEILPVLKALFASEHFFDEANKGAMIKNPIDLILGFWRTTEMQHIEESNANLKYTTMREMYWGFCYQVGMRIGDPPSVSGWPAYYQVPSFDKLWITTDTITRRAQYVDALIGQWAWVGNPDYRLGVNLIRFLEHLPDPGNPNQMIDDVADLLFGTKITSESHEYVKSSLLSGQSTDSYWTEAWVDYQGEPTNETYRSVVENRLRNAFRALTHLGEFQLM